VKACFAAHEKSGGIAVNDKLGADDRFNSLPACFFDEANDAAEIGRIGEAEGFVAEVGGVGDQSVRCNAAVSKGESGVCSELHKGHNGAMYRIKPETASGLHNPRPVLWSWNYTRVGPSGIRGCTPGGGISAAIRFASSRSSLARLRSLGAPLRA
jgi:hypothetical protein